VRAAGLLLAVLLAGTAAAQPAAQVQEPAEVVDALHAALKDGDRRKALELLAADVLIFEQGRIERTRTEYARQHLADDIAFASVTERTVLRRSVKVQGDAAWVTSVNRTRGRFRNRSVDLTTDETMILVRAAGKWRIVHIHWSFDDRTTH
jgi:ketosteroid isomerase-like protein